MRIWIRRQRQLRLACPVKVDHQEKLAALGFVFRVHGARDENGVMLHWTVVEANMSHCDACIRSQANHHVRAKKQGLHSKLSPAQVTVFKTIMDWDTPIYGQRKFLSRTLPNAVLTAQAIANIRSRVLKLYTQNVVNATMDPDSVDPDVTYAQQEKETCQLIHEALLAGMWPLEKLLANRTDKKLGFDYRVWANNKGQPVGVVWIDPRMKAKAELFSDVLFLDAKASGGNDLR
jgi:hypothetical protein